MKVPFVDLGLQYQSIKKEVDAAIANILDTNAFIMGKPVETFEGAFGEFLNVKHCISVSNGTSAIYLALQGLGVGEGDEVIVPSHTFIGSVEPITMLGASPIFVDIIEGGYTLDPEDVKKKITDKTKAIIPVHLYGQACDMDAIMEIAEEHKLHVIEDACQAHGAEFNGKNVGTIGDAGCFSFYPAKNLGCYGDGGMVVTNNEDLAEKMAMVRDHGREKGQKYTHAVEGFNFRMDALQAAVLSVKLGKLANWNEQRKNHARLYTKLLDGVVGTPEDNGEGVFHLYVIQHDKRDDLKKHLDAKGVSTGIHYPLPMHLQPAFSYLGYNQGDLPNTEKVVGKILSLPMFPELTGEQIKFVCDSIKEF